MTDSGSVTISPEILRRVAKRLIDSHGHAALAIAALSASRSARVNGNDEARFWLGVCNEIRAARRHEAMAEAQTAVIN